MKKARQSHPGGIDVLMDAIVDIRCRKQSWSAASWAFQIEELLSSKGYAIVPVKPTRPMLDEVSQNRAVRAAAKGVWRTMLSRAGWGGKPGDDWPASIPHDLWDKINKIREKNRAYNKHPKEG